MVGVFPLFTRFECHQQSIYGSYFLGIRGFIFCQINIKLANLLSIFVAACDFSPFTASTYSSLRQSWCLYPPLPPTPRPPAGLFTDRWLLQEPLPGRAAAQGGQRSSAGVQGDSSDCHPGAEGSDDKAHIWWPLHLQSKCFITSRLSLHCTAVPVWVWVCVKFFWGIDLSFRASRPGWPRCTCPCSVCSKRMSTGWMWKKYPPSLSTTPTR